MKQAKKMRPVRNLVLKNMQRTGAGQHKAKYGKFVSRARQKQLSRLWVQ